MAKLIGMDGGEMPPERVNINILTQPTIACANCTGLLFTSVTVFKKISRLLTGTPQDQVVPIELFRCVECGSIMTDTLPSPDHLDLLLFGNSTEDGQ